MIIMQLYCPFLENEGFAILQTENGAVSAVMQIMYLTDINASKHCFTTPLPLPSSSLERIQYLHFLQYNTIVTLICLMVVSMSREINAAYSLDDMVIRWFGN